MKHSLFFGNGHVWRQTWGFVEGGLTSWWLFDWCQVLRNFQDGGRTSLSDCVVEGGGLLLLGVSIGTEPDNVRSPRAADGI